MTRLADLLDTAVDRAAGTTAVGAAADAIGKVVSIPPGRVKDGLSGTSAGHPVHPVLATAAIGLLTSTNLLDALGERRAARRVLVAGLLSAVPTVAAGWSDWADTEGHEKRVGILHSSTNALGTVLYGASLVQRRRGGSGALLAAAGGALMGVGGWLGGHLSYALGVGVDTTAFQAGPEDWTDVAAAEAVGDEPLGVEADGVPVVLVRSGGRVRALADRCTHRGGPLSDGELTDGCLVCPWHQSAFDATTGSVRQGPATRPQPVYETREEGGRVLVRRQEDRALRSNPVGV